MNKSLFFSLGAIAFGCHAVVAQEQEAPGMVVSLQDASVTSFLLSDVACVRFNDQSGVMTVVSQDRSVSSFDMSQVEHVKFVGVEPVNEDVSSSNTAVGQLFSSDGWFVVYDLLGRIVKTGNTNLASPEVGLTPGAYLIKSGGLIRKIVVK